MSKKLVRIPETIIIAGLSFHVDKVVLEDKYGDCDLTERKIRLSPERSLDVQEQTLFHEVIHACLGVGGLSEMLSEAQEEAVVVALDNLLWPLVEFRGRS